MLEGKFFIDEAIFSALDSVFFNHYYFLNYIYMCVLACMWICAYVYRGTRSQKQASDPWSEVIGSYKPLTLVPETTLRYST